MKKYGIVREYWERYVFNVGCHGPRQLCDVYNKWSGAKQEAWDQIASFMYGFSWFSFAIFVQSSILGT